jgi:hypothetical protein
MAQFSSNPSAGGMEDFGTSTRPGAGHRVPPYLGAILQSRSQNRAPQAEFRDESAQKMFARGECAISGRLVFGAPLPADSELA